MWKVLKNFTIYAIIKCGKDNSTKSRVFSTKWLEKTCPFWRGVLYNKAIEKNLRRGFMTENQKIGEKIATLRKNSGFTQADVGVYLNISYQAVSKWERGESCPDFATISRLARLFNVPISYFEEGEESAPTETAPTPVKTESTEGELVGVCKECGKALRQGEEGTTSPVVLCKECEEFRKQLEIEKMASILKTEEEKRIAEEQRKKDEERARLKKKREEERAREEHRKWEEQQAYLKQSRISARRKLSFTIAGIIAGAIASIFVFVGLGNASSKGGGFLAAAVVCGLVFSGFTFTYVSQLFWDGVVVEWTLFGGHVIGTPGIIFDLSLEGLGFLLVMKIVFAILRFTVYILTMLACVVAAIAISPFTFFPALQRVNAGDF